TVGGLQFLGKGEERAIGQVVAVDEEELGVADRGVVELELLTRQGLGHRSTLRQAFTGQSRPRRSTSVADTLGTVPLLAPRPAPLGIARRHRARGRRRRRPAAAAA